MVSRGKTPSAQVDTSRRASALGPISAETYVELIRSLFDTLLPTLTMAVSFAMVGAIVVFRTPGDGLVALYALGIAAAAGRIITLLRYRADAANPDLTVSRARRMEVRYGAVYVGFAVIFGLFSAVAYARVAADIRGIVVALVFGYGAGVAAGLSVRPQIGIPAIAIATAPMIVSTLYLATMPTLALGVLLSVFLAGGIHAMVVRYRAVSAGLTTIGSFSSLVRHDYLTGLGNRLALRETFEKFAAVSGNAEIIAVHCLDLDRFKPVNDRYGHPVGDALLVAVAARLHKVLRSSDFAARVGGDEFIVVQTEARQTTDVELLARRIVHALAEPFAIEGHRIVIGTSIGYVLSADYGVDLDDLITRADQALYQAKRDGGGIVSYEAVVRPMAPPRALGA